MSKKCVDHIGQEIVIGDWAVVTQHNRLYVGKVIKAGNSVTIAVDAKDEFIQVNPQFKKLPWQDKHKVLKAKGYSGSWNPACSWARDGKFIKITPTEEMLIAYDK